MKPTLLFAIIGVAITGLFGYHGIYVRQQAQGRLIQTQIAQERENQQALADAAVLLQQLQQYRKRLPPEPDPSWLVREAVALAEHAGVQLTTLTQDAPKPLSQFTRLAVSLQFRASYHQLGAFLDELEHAHNYLRVESLDISRPQDEGGQATIKLVVSTVYLPPVRTSAGS